MLRAGPSGPLKDTLQEYLKLLTNLLKVTYFIALSTQNVKYLANAAFKFKAQNLYKNLGFLGPYPLIMQVLIQCC